MSWLSSLLIAGAVFASGLELPDRKYSNTYPTTNTKIAKAVKNKKQDETERFEKTYSFNPDGKIEISNINGSITVEAWDRPEINLVATKIADSKERLSDVQIEIEESQSRFSVKTDYKSWKNRNQNGKYQKYSKLEVNFQLKVPRRAILDEIESVNGSVEVSNMNNYTVISAVNGTVIANNLRGTAKLSTVNGTVNADFDQLNTGSIISLGTVNGSVKLTVPSAVNATVKADTVNGSISNQFGLPVRKGKYVGRDLYGRIGNGDVKIKLSSVNGGLYINRKNDGGTPNPAVNLLKEKNSRDFDDSFEMEIDLNVSKMRKQINKAVKESQKATAAVILSEKEIAKISENAANEAAKALKDVDKVLDEKLITEALIDAEKFRRAAEAIETEEFEKNIEEARLSKTAELARIADSVRLSRSPYVVEKEGSLKVIGIPEIRIDADNCSVQVRGWDKPEIKYSITRIVRNRNLEEPNVSVSQSNNEKEKAKKDSRVEIKVLNEASDMGVGNRNRTNEVRVEVFVPKKSNLRIHTNKDIRLEGVSGELRLFGQDNSINVRDADGDLRISSTDGMIRVIGFEGRVWSETIDGDTMLEGNFKRIFSKSKDGNIIVTLPETANAKIFSNVKATIEGFKEVRNDKGYQIIGEGEYKFNFTVRDEAKVLLRNGEIADTN